MDKVNSNYQLWLYQEYSEELKKGLRPELIAHLRLFVLVFILYGSEIYLKVKS